MLEETSYSREWAVQLVFTAILTTSWWQRSSRREVGESEVDAFKDHHPVGVEELHVHRHNADALLEDLPVATTANFHYDQESYMKEDEKERSCHHFMKCVNGMSLDYETE